MRRRGSRISGKKLPLRNFGIPTCRSPALVDNTLDRHPLRCETRSGERSQRSAPIASTASSSINSWSAQTGQLTDQVRALPNSERGEQFFYGRLRQSHRRVLLDVHLDVNTEPHAGDSPRGGPEPKPHHTKGLILVTASSAVSCGPRHCGVMVMSTALFSGHRSVRSTSRSLRRACTCHAAWVPRSPRQATAGRGRVRSSVGIRRRGEDARPPQWRNRHSGRGHCDRKR